MLISNSIFILIFSFLSITVSKILESIGIKNNLYIFFFSCILVGYICHFTGKDVYTLALCEIITIILLSIAFNDIRTHIIPDYFHIYIIIAALLTIDYTKIYINLACVLGLYIIFAIVNKIKDGAMGGGDIKLTLSLAFLTGLKIFPILILSTITFVVVSLIKKHRNKHKENEGYAFAPYISAFAIPLLLI